MLTEIQNTNTMINGIPEWTYKYLNSIYKENKEEFDEYLYDATIEAHAYSY